MVEPRKLGTADLANVGMQARAQLGTQGNAVTFEGGSNSPSFITPDASVLTPETNNRNREQLKDTFGLKIFGRSPTKKMTARDIAKEMKKKAKEEETAARKREEEKKKEEDEVNQEDNVESDHHGRIHVDYRLPRPSAFPVSTINIFSFLALIIYPAMYLVATIQIHK